jgi:hypothetical protein
MHITTDLKNNIITSVVAIVIFIFLSVAYMYPALEGKNIQQSDVIQHRGMSKELVDFRKETGKEGLWTNSMYGGMPGYFVSTRFLGNKLSYIHKLFILNDWRPVCFIFLYLLGFYVTLLAFGVNRWLSIAGAIAYGFSSYLFIIIEVGHISKVLALGYMPAIIGGIHLAFRGKYLWGSLMMAIALGLQIYVVHIQITYYTLIIILIFGLFELIYAIKEKALANFGKSILVLLIGVTLAIGSNIASLWTTHEYGKYSIRGPSELSYSNEENKTSGLDKDYATQWSYGISETFTLLIPNFMGGASGGELPENSETYKLLSRIQGKANARKAIKQMPTYWGDVIFTSGPVYAGAIVCFLFVLGLFIVDPKYRWWLLTVTIVSFILAWGRNVPNITNFLLDHLPAYNKFRAVSMTLVIAGFSIPLMAILAFDKVISKKVDRKHLEKALLYSGVIVAGILLFLIAFAGSLFSFEALSDENYLAKGYNDLVDAFQSDRLMLLRKDAFRSLVFVLLTILLIYLLLKEKLKKEHAILALGFLFLFDLWPIDKRYLNKDNFVRKKDYENPIVASKADEIILSYQDPDLDYRVLNLTVNPLLDATTSYFHKSVGGYHGAKMRRFQEIYERHIVPEIQEFSGKLNSGNHSMAFTETGVLNMFNTKYIIHNREAPPIVNRNSLGNAWFVSSYQIVENADEEIVQVGEINTSTSAVIDKRFKHLLDGKTINFDSTGLISLVEYKPNYLKYKTKAKSEQLAIFSEIHYPKGWNATINGEPAEHLRANYVLRGMIIPAGEHTIEFSFRPKSYYVGEKISLISSLLLLLVLLGSIALYFKKQIEKQSVSD